MAKAGGQQRDRIKLPLKDDPSLKSYLDEAVIEAYRLALSLVVRETPLDYPDLPSDCPYCQSQILDSNFLEDLSLR